MALADLFGEIADAIREKDGTTAEIVATDFPARIRAIPAGGIQLASISITKTPTKTSYLVGDVFDPSGIEVKATYSNGSTAIVTGFSYAPSGPLAETDTAITVSYMEQGTTKTAQQPISVVADVVIGVMWDPRDPSTAMTRLTVDSDPNKLVTVDITTEPVPAVGGGAGSSPFDNYRPWNGMEEYNIVDNAVVHKRGDEGFSRSLDTVVYIPEYWYKVVVDGTTAQMYFYVSSGPKNGFEKHPGSGKYVGRYNTGAGYVSKTGLAPLVDITRAQARTGSAGKGANWSQYDFASWGAVEFLFRVEFADWDSQSKVGRGYVDGNSAAINSGATDSMTYHTGRAAGTDGKTAVQYRGIENPWGNVFEWIDGINFNNRASYICLDHTKYADDTESNYTNSGITLPTSGWIKNIGVVAFRWAFLPDTTAAARLPAYRTTCTREPVGGSSGWAAGASGRMPVCGTSAPTSARRTRARTSAPVSFIIQM